MKYLLDTNICIYIINEKPRNVLSTFEQHPVHDFGISSVTHAELQYGVAGSKYRRKNQAALDRFLLPLTILPFHGREMAEHYGRIRTFLESQGNPIGPLDTMIAAHASSLGLTLISNNTREFSRIPHLDCENWVSGA